MLCRAATLRIKRKSNHCYPRALAVQTHTAGHSPGPARHGSMAGKGREAESPLQKAPLISKDDAIDHTDEHLPSASEQVPWEGWESAGVTISSGAFHPNKNISLLYRLNRDPQNTFFKSSLERRAKISSQVGTPGWQRHREMSCIPKKHPHISWSQLCPHSSHQARKASMSERGWSNICNIQVWHLQLSAHLSSMSLQVWSKHRSLGFRRLHWRKSWWSDSPEVWLWLSHIHLCHFKLPRSSCSAKWL